MLKHMPEKKEIDLSSVVLSPMPGIVKSIAVEVGQKVIEGHEICTVEAMKMQNKLVANRTGVVNLDFFDFLLIFYKTILKNNKSFLILIGQENQLQSK